MQLVEVVVVERLQIMILMNPVGTVDPAVALLEPMALVGKEPVVAKLVPLLRAVPRAPMIIRGILPTRQGHP